MPALVRIVAALNDSLQAGMAGDHRRRDRGNYGWSNAACRVTF